MEKFTASNGLMLVPHRDGSVRWEAGFSPTVVTAALRECFLHERDQKLGRWRERPSCTTVVYPNGADDLGNRCVIVLYEPTAGVTAVYENNIPGNLYGDAARNYFAAHPELKPWHEAKHNEIWVLQIKDCHAPEPYRFAQDTTCADSCVFRPVSNPKRVFFDSRSPMIVDAHRIYPEASDE